MDFTVSLHKRPYFTNSKAVYFVEIMFQEIFTPSLYCCEGAEVGQFSYDVQISSLSSITSTCNQKWMWSFFHTEFWFTHGGVTLRLS